MDKKTLERGVELSEKKKEFQNMLDTLDIIEKHIGASFTDVSHCWQYTGDLLKEIMQNRTHPLSIKWLEFLLQSKKELNSQIEVINVEFEQL